MPKPIRLLAAALLVLAAAACDRHPPMSVRTYTLHRLEPDQALSLLTPYVREGGYLTATANLVTVRETPEQLERIAGVLREFDGGPRNVVLRFQVIEADGFTGTDSAIADVEAQLRGLFRYRGYRLMREITVLAAESGTFGRDEGGMALNGKVREISGDSAQQSVFLDVNLQTRDAVLTSAVNAPIGKTIVLGTQKESAREGAIILAVRPELQ